MRAVLILALLAFASAADADAICADGHVSLANRHSGACSHHGGVSSWGRHGAVGYTQQGPSYWGQPTYLPSTAGTRFYGEIGTVHYGY